MKKIHRNYRNLSREFWLRKAEKEEQEKREQERENEREGERERERERWYKGNK